MSHEDHHKFIMETLKEAQERIDNLEAKVNILFSEKGDLTK